MHYKPIFEDMCTVEQRCLRYALLHNGRQNLTLRWPTIINIRHRFLQRYLTQARQQNIIISDKTKFCIHMAGG